MSTYKHGAYAEILPTQDYMSPRGAGTLPVYFGMAPVHQLLGDYKVGTPVMVARAMQAEMALGSSTDWRTYSLCEPVDAHFRNNIQKIGPIVLVNVLDPAKHRESEETEAQIAFVKGRAELPDPGVILSTLQLEGRTLDKDYQVAWSHDGSSLIFSALAEDMGTEEATYYRVAPEAVGEDEVIAAIKAVTPMVYQATGMIPTILAAPRWSSLPAVAEALSTAADKINGHWYAYVAADLPATHSINTPAKAQAYKQDNGLGSSTSDLCWPCARKGDKVYHLSTLDVVTMQQVDLANDNVPYESPSNKPVDITGLCLEDGTPVSFDKEAANALNSVGVQTAIYWGGRWVLWGSQTSGFTHGVEQEAKDMFGATMRMTQYLANDFQLRYGHLVSKPMARAMVDTILNDTQQRLDGYVSSGQLLHGAVSFLPSSNSEGDMAAGDFVFDIADTTTPPAKSITARIRWTSQGLSLLTGGVASGD